MARSTLAGGPILARDTIAILFEDYYGGKSESTFKACKKGWEDFRRFIGAETPFQSLI
jgi:hypothetical protein